MNSAKDPVCGMEVNTGTAKYMTTLNGKTFYFCNKGCKDAFEKESDRYTKE